MIFLSSKTSDGFRASEIFVKFPEMVGNVGKFIGCDNENVAANVESVLLNSKRDFQFPRKILSPWLKLYNVTIEIKVVSSKFRK